jgi:hypothetical protein
MKRLWFVLAISLMAFGCKRIQSDENLNGSNPIGATEAAVQDTSRNWEVDPEYHEDANPQNPIPDSLQERSYTKQQVDSLKRTMKPPSDDHGKGYDGRLPKDSVRRQEMLRHQAFRRVQDSIWQKEELAKKLQSQQKTIGSQKPK